MRLIDADALIAEYDRVHIGQAGGARKLMVDAPTVDAVHRETLAQVMWERDVAMGQLEEHAIPFGCKADVQAVVHGEWKEYGLRNPQCSICKKFNYETSRFCPNCGARMDGKVSE